MFRSALILIVFFALLFAAAHAQTRISGTVTSVVDAKTLVIKTDAGNLTAELQYVDPPDSDQLLYSSIVDHLKKLTVGKFIYFYPGRMLGARTVGQLTCNGVDISMQMIRDGGGWHTPPNFSGQSELQALEYQRNQNLARSEKRGVWSVPGLRASSQFRVDAYDLVTRHDVDEWSVFLRPATTEIQNSKVRSSTAVSETIKFESTKTEIWPDRSTAVSGGLSDPVAGYDPGRREGFVTSSAGSVTLIGPRSTRELELRAIYVYRGEPGIFDESAYILAFESESADTKFSGTNSLTIVADGRNIVIGQARRMWRQVKDGVQELLLYKVGKTTLSQIASAKKLVVRFPRYNGTIDRKIQPGLKHLIETTR